MEFVYNKIEYGSFWAYDAIWISASLMLCFLSCPLIYIAFLLNSGLKISESLRVMVMIVLHWFARTWLLGV